jgi:hypothetical protein
MQFPHPISYYTVCKKFCPFRRGGSQTHPYDGLYQSDKTFVNPYNHFAAGNLFRQLQ